MDRNAIVDQIEAHCVSNRYEKASKIRVLSVLKQINLENRKEQYLKAIIELSFLDLPELVRVIHHKSVWQCKDEEIGSGLIITQENHRFVFYLLEGSDYAMKHNLIDLTNFYFEREHSGIEEEIIVYCSFTSKTRSRFAIGKLSENSQRLYCNLFSAYEKYIGRFQPSSLTLSLWD